MPPPPYHAYLAAFGTVAIWTGFILISRLGGKSVLTGWDILALRLGTASVLLPFASRLPPSAWRDRRLWCLALVGGLGFGVCAYAGFKLAPAVHAAILIPGLQPFLITLLAWWLAGERPAAHRWWGYGLLGLGVTSAAVPALQGGWQLGQLIGDGLFLAASLLWAVYSVLGKRWGYSPWTLTCFVALASAAAYLPAYALLLPKQLLQAPPALLLLQALYQGLGPTIIAMVLYLKAVTVLGPARMGSLIALVPVLAGLGAVPLLDEPLTGWLLAGAVSVTLGAYLAVREPPRAAAPAAGIPAGRQPSQ